MSSGTAVWLFKKRLSLRDVNLGLGELVLEECSQAMKEVLARLVRERTSRYVKVLAEDPNGTFYELRLMNYPGGIHVLADEWSLIVVANELEKGDTVEGWGNVVGDGGGGEIYFTCELDIRPNNQEESLSSGNRFPEHKRGDDGDERKTPAEGDDAKYSPPSSEKSKPVGGNEKNMSSSQETAADSPTQPILFKKTLSHSDVNVAMGELVVEECSEAMKEVLAAPRRYVKILAEDPNGAVFELRLMNHSGGDHVLVHDWDSIVIENGLKIGDTVEARGHVVDDSDDEIYFYCELDVHGQNPEGSSSSSSSGEGDLPSSGNQGPEHKRGDEGDERKTPAKGDDAKNASEASEERR